MNFEMGILTWEACLPQVMIMFADGEPPADAGVNVDLCPPGSIIEGGVRRFGVTFPEAFFPAGEMHGMITGAQLKLDTAALGDAVFMKNLGAHEFGHALGLDEDPRPPGTARSSVMDPEFDRTSPFIGLSDSDKMMLGEHYTLPDYVVNAPDGGSSLMLLAVAVVGLVGCRQRYAKEND